MPPLIARALKWEIEYLTAIVQYRKHLKIVANILN
jgi:hypothetical protein